MSTEPTPLRLELEITAGPDQDADRIDRETRNLRREIADLGAESVELIGSDSAPAGAKAAEVITLGALAIAVLPDLLPNLVSFLRDWVMRGETRTIKIKTTTEQGAVEVEYNPETTSPEDLQEVVKKLAGALRDT